MARYKKGINGPFSGKVGRVVGASWRGVDYLKGKHRKPTKPATEAQLRQRGILTLVNSWVKPIKDIIWIGFQVFKGAKTPVNGAVSLIMREAVMVDTAEPGIDFPRVILSRGELLISWVLEVLALPDAVLQVKWGNAAVSALNRDEDRANFIVYNPVKEKFVTFQGAALRADQEMQLQLPVDFLGDEIHCYMFYVNEDGDAVSTSQYLGLVRVVE
jgi:hypothetical protein